MAFKTFDIGVGDGHVAYSRAGFAGGWDNVHDSPIGSEATPIAVLAKAGCFKGISWNHFKIWRTFLPLNLISEPMGVRYVGFPTATPRVNLYVTVKMDDDNDGDDYLTIVGLTSQADPTTLVIQDYDQCGLIDNPTKLSVDRDLGVIGVAAYNNWPLNAAGVAAMEAAFGVGYFLMGMREGHDQEDSAIAGVGDIENSMTFKTSEDFSFPISPPTVTGDFVLPQVI